MPFLAFIGANARWLAGGFLLFFCSSPGQTFFISLSAGNIREEYGLSHGTFGSLYMAATLASALTLTRLGQAVDRYGARQVVTFTLPMLALASALMALSQHVVLLLGSLYLLRLFGQGMMSHTAFTLMGRWFSAQRGRAVSLTTLGMNTGEALLPLTFVALSGSIGWRNAWWLMAFALVVLALPAVTALFAVERDPRASDPVARAATARDWTRAEMLRDPLFPLVMLAMAPPAFIGNTIFFHQVHLAELRGWPPEVFASSFTLYAAMTIVFTLVSGQLVDRVSGVALLPFYLLPLGLGCVVLGSGGEPWICFVFMALYGLSNGFSFTLFGSLWPELYGVGFLGSIRAVIMAMLVFASAAGPGLAGLLIDAGIGYPGQVVAMGIYCLMVSAAMVPVASRLKARRAGAASAAAVAAPGDG
ncbi:MFS transporter (plasmid) [Skermanella rosea]|uniref:MFS transporter n=1 Tax=Skermanella rosea TaxID=1817965 RepID=UPI0019332ACF|nr:MFS transporter [Skermanella rosea]UEM07934.1 MFS transporter [Skermanella rosea]